MPRRSPRGVARFACRGYSTAVQSGKSRGFGGRAPKGHFGAHEKRQLIHRIPVACVAQILEQFNAGVLDARTAAERLEVGQSQLYTLRQQWLRQRRTWVPQASGGSRRTDWPADVVAFLTTFVPHCQPLNFALLRDALVRRFAFVRSRASVAACVREHFAHALPPLPRGPKPRRRWQCATIGELDQHDSPPHAWWPGSSLQVLILTIDDHSRKIVAGAFAADTTWDHFCLLRPTLESSGAPAAFYTDGLSLFGHTSTDDRLDTPSQFQRALTALGIAHRVAPDAPAKGKIERRFGYFQRRLVSLLAYERIQNHDDANALLQAQIAHYNAQQVCRTTNRTPNQAWEQALQENRSSLRPPHPHPNWISLWPCTASAVTTPTTPWTSSAEPGP